LSEIRNQILVRVILLINPIIERTRFLVVRGVEGGRLLFREREWSWKAVRKEVTVGVVVEERCMKSNILLMGR
jgi:hypothetical protein